MVIAEVKNLTKIYGRGPGAVKALDGVSVQIESESLFR